MSLKKCKLCGKTYSDMFEKCPFCDGKVKSALKEVDERLNKKRLQQLFRRLINNKDRFLEKNASYFSDYTYKKIDEYINVILVECKDMDESKFEDIYDQFDKYLDSLTYDNFSNPNFFKLNSKKFVVEIKYEYLHKIGKNTVIEFPKNSVGCKGKLIQGYDTDRDGDSYSYHVPHYLLENIECKNIIFPPNYVVDSYSFSDVKVKDIDFNANVTCKDKCGFLIIKEFEINNTNKKLPPNIYSIEELHVNNVRGYKYNIDNIFGIVFLNNSFIGQSFNAQKYIYDTSNDYLEDSFYIKDFITHPSNGILLQSESKYWNYKGKDYGIHKIFILNIEKYLTDDLVIHIPSHIKNAFFPLDYFPRGKGKIVTFVCNGNTKLTSNDPFHKDYYCKVDYDGVPSSVPENVDSIKINGITKCELTQSENSKTKPIKCRNIYIDDINELSLFSKYAEERREINIFQHGKLLNKTIDLPNVTFEGNPFDGFGIHYFEKIVIYPENFEKTVPPIEVKELVLKEGVKKLNLDLENHYQHICSNIVIPSSLENPLDEILTYYQSIKNIEMASSSQMNNRSIRICYNVENIFVNDSIKNANATFDIIGCFSDEFAIHFKDRLIAIDRHEDLKLRISDGDYQLKAK